MKENDYLNIDEEYKSGADIYLEQEYLRKKHEAFIARIEQRRREEEQLAAKLEAEKKAKELEYSQVGDNEFDDYDGLDETSPSSQTTTDNKNNISDQEDDDISPIASVEGHTWIGEDDIDTCYRLDDEDADYIKDIVNEFSRSSLYTDWLTSTELAEFVSQNINVGYIDSQTYNPKEALTDALEGLAEEYPECFEDATEIKFIIYIGRNFEKKKHLITTAKQIINNFLWFRYNTNFDTNVAIALNTEIEGPGALGLYAFSI